MTAEQWIELAADGDATATYGVELRHGHGHRKSSRPSANTIQAAPISNLKLKGHSSIRSVASTQTLETQFNTNSSESHLHGQEPNQARNLLINSSSMGLRRQGCAQRDAPRVACLFGCTDSGRQAGMSRLEENYSGKSAWDHRTRARQWSWARARASQSGG
jgi:hypothetical protein